MSAETKNSRTKILEAAEELSREVGPGNISLDAVAARAGLSKGGLLYNFPSKAKLMEALVEMHIARTQDALVAAEKQYKALPNSVARAIIDVYRVECGAKKPPASGVLAAIAENPEFIAPIRLYQRELVERLKAESDDPEIAGLTFLVIEGLRCMNLFETQVFSDDEIAALMNRLSRLLDQTPGKKTD